MSISPGRTFRRGQPGYEAARRATMWNARFAERYPDIVVQANDVYDVVSALRLARNERMRVGVRSGGHSFSRNHVRDGGMLLDVSRLDGVSIDADAMRATAGPGCRGSELMAKLMARGLFFPGGHCKGVCLGGYLLQGGFGWHGRALGPACESVEALDLVTADADLVHASPAENADLYWAARGAGPGFFGVVTRFHLRLHRKPRVIGMAVQTFPVARLEEVYRWAHAAGPEVPASVELQLILSRHIPTVDGPGIAVFAPVFADGPIEALRAVAFMNRGPLRRKARVRVPFAPVPLSLMYDVIMTHYPAGRRYGVDNMWTHATIDDLLPGLHRIAETLPPAPSHALWMNWAPPPDRPDMAYSMEDDTYLALYGVWQDEKDDPRYATWAVDRMREMEPLSTGVQLADENLGERPARFVSDAHLARLDQIRATRDPAGRFHPWMGRP